MDIFTGQGHKSGTLIRVIKVIVLYLILINSSKILSIANFVLTPSLKDISRNWHIDKKFSPKMSKRSRSTLLKGWIKAVKRTLIN